MMLTIRVNLSLHNSLPRFHNPYTLFHHPISTILRTKKPENQTHFQLRAQNNGRSSSNNSGPPPGGNRKDNGGGDDWEDNNEARYETPRYNCNPNGYIDMPLDNVDLKTVVSVGSALLKTWTNMCEQISIWTTAMLVAAGCTIAAAAAAVLVFFILPIFV